MKLFQDALSNGHAGRERFKQHYVFSDADSDDVVIRLYNKRRLANVKARQRFVLDYLAASGAVIESCPTSNLRIGGVPSPELHPIHQFLASDVNLAICAGDPGFFDSPLANEVNWVIEHTGYSVESLIGRLGDPRRFQLGNLRQNGATPAAYLATSGQ